MCKVVVLFIKPIAFLPFSLLSASSFLKLPITFSIKRETRQFHVVVEKEKKMYQEVFFTCKVVLLLI